jgi:hypothetical protein
LTDIKLLTKEGTQARVDAEIALNEKLKDIEIQSNISKASIADIEKKRLQDVKNANIENALAVFNLKKALLETEKLDIYTKTQRTIELAKQEAAAQIEALNFKRDAEILAAETAGLTTTAIKEKYRLQTGFGKGESRCNKSSSRCSSSKFNGS